MIIQTNFPIADISLNRIINVIENTPIASSVVNLLSLASEFKITIEPNIQYTIRNGYLRGSLSISWEPLLTFEEATSTGCLDCPMVFNIHKNGEVDISCRAFNTYQKSTEDAFKWLVCKGINHNKMIQNNEFYCLYQK